MSWPPFMWLFVMGTTAYSVVQYQNAERENARRRLSPRRKLKSFSEASVKSPSREERVFFPESPERQSEKMKHHQFSPRWHRNYAGSEENLIKENGLMTLEQLSLNPRFVLNFQQSVNTHNPFFRAGPARNLSYAPNQSNRNQSFSSPQQFTRTEFDTPPSLKSYNGGLDPNETREISTSSSDTITYSVYEAAKRSKSLDEMSVTENPLFPDAFQEVESVSTFDRTSSPSVSFSIPHIPKETPQSCDRGIQTDEIESSEVEVVIISNLPKPRPLTELMEEALPVAPSADQTTSSSYLQQSASASSSGNDLVINLEMILKEEHLSSYANPPQTKIVGAARSFSFQSDISAVDASEISPKQKQEDPLEAATPKIFKSPVVNSLFAPGMLQSPLSTVERGRPNRRRSSSNLSVDSSLSQDFRRNELDGLTLAKPVIAEKTFIDSPRDHKVRHGIAFSDLEKGEEGEQEDREEERQISAEESRLLLNSWTSLLSSPPQMHRHCYHRSFGVTVEGEEDKEEEEVIEGSSTKEVLFRQLHQLFPSVEIEIDRAQGNQEPGNRLARLEKKPVSMGDLNLNLPASNEPPMEVTVMAIQDTPTTTESSPLTLKDSPPPSLIPSPPITAATTTLPLDAPSVVRDSPPKEMEGSGSSSHLLVTPNTEVVTVSSSNPFITNYHTPPSTKTAVHDHKENPIASVSSNHTVHTLHSNSSASSSAATTFTRKSTGSYRSAISKVERATSNYIHSVDQFIRTRTDFYSPGYYYNVQKLFETLPPPKELKIKTIKEYRSFFKKYPHYFKLSSDQKSMELLSLTPILAMFSTSSGDEAGGAFLPVLVGTEGEMSVNNRSPIPLEFGDNATVSTMTTAFYLYGYFHCVSKYCHKRWNSRHALENTSQICPRCHVRVYPYQLRPLQPEDQDYDDSDDETNPRSHKYKQNKSEKANVGDRKARGGANGGKVKRNSPIIRINEDEEYEGEGEEEYQRRGRKRGISVEGYFDYPHDLQLTTELDYK